MRSITQKLVSGGRRTLLVASLAMVLLTSLVFGPATQSASAVTCREQVVYAYYNQMVYGPEWQQYQITRTNDNISGTFTVPPSSVSGCNYINVKHITGGWGTGGHCWSFRVFWYDSEQWTSEGGYCAGPTTVTGIAGPVANGTRYEVMIVPNNNLMFILRD